MVVGVWDRLSEVENVSTEKKRCSVSEVWIATYLCCGFCLKKLSQFKNKLYETNRMKPYLEGTHRLLSLQSKIRTDIGDGTSFLRPQIMNFLFLDRWFYLASKSDYYTNDPELTFLVHFQCDLVVFEFLSS